MRNHEPRTRVSLGAAGPPGTHGSRSAGSSPILRSGRACVCLAMPMPRRQERLRRTASWASSGSSTCPSSLDATRAALR
eukprot:11194184-Lingulodinium_polyedra.AAC.1